MIREKLQKCRVELLSHGLKKSGRNSFANFDYFELADFLPAAQKILFENGLSSHFSMTKETASLSISDDKESVDFSIPVVMSENQKQNPIQSLGATITYLRRYLWLVAMEIVEADAIDVLPPEQNKVIEKKEDIETLYNSFLSLEKIKDIPAEKKENIEKVKQYYNEKKLKINTLKNAIEFLGGLNEKIEDKKMVFEKLSDSDLELAFEGVKND